MISLLLITILLSLITYWWYRVLLMRYELRWITKVPGLPLIGNVLELQDTKDLINVFDKYTKKYNGFCRMEAFTMTGLLISDYKVLEFLLTTTKVLNKSLQYEFLEGWLGTGLLTAPGAKWKTRRKLITPAFHFSILEQFVDAFESNGNVLIDILNEQASNEYFDAFPLIKRCALDIICEAAMGVSINAQRHVNSDYVMAVQEMCRIITERGPNLLKLFDLTYPLTKDYYKEQKYIKILHSQTESVIKAKLEALKNKTKTEENEKEDEVLGVKKKKAFLDLLLESVVNGEPLSQSDIREEVDTFMFAGHDTTTSAICFTLYNLAKYPNIQNEAFEEQKSLFGSDMNKNATHRDLQDMKYLEMVIKENLRLFPPVPFVGRKTDQVVEYEEGKVIPKQVNMVLFIYGANRNSSYFQDPDKFDPTRFTTLDGQLPFAYIPFSAGPRNCIGQKFAMLEIKSVVSKILRNFEVHPAGANFEPILAAEAVLVSRNGINLKFKKR